MKPTIRREWSKPWGVTLSIRDDEPDLIRVATIQSRGADITIEDAKTLRRTLKRVIRKAKEAETREIARRDAVALKAIKARRGAESQKATKRIAKRRKREGLE